MADEREVLVEVKNLEVTYGSGRKAYKAVSNANFIIYKGETFGLVGVLSLIHISEPTRPY